MAQTGESGSVGRDEPLAVQFGKYLLDGEIARGGMSRVHRARLRGPGGFEKKLVVKQILPHLARDPSFIELFVREANTLVQMSHPHIVPVYELGVVDGVYFLAMELVQGATVAELLRDGPLPEALVAQIGAQVAEALRYAHERFELVHRDVTPRNVIVDRDGHVRLLDFGIAAPLAHTGRGERFGSPGYMSPEQARGTSLGPGSDLFSLGTVLYEALTGQRAIARRGDDSLPADPPRRLPEDGPFDATVATTINRMLELNPEARPASAAEVAAELRTWLAERHPGGVAEALGARVEQARSRAGAAAVEAHAPDDAGDAGDRRAAEDSGTPRLTRSIATSPALRDIVSQATEPMTDRRPRPSGSGGQASPREPVRGALLGALVGAVLLAVGGVGLIAFGGDSVTESGSESDTESGSASASVTDAVTDADSDSVAGSDSITVTGSVADSESESDTGSVADSESESDTGSVADSESGSVTVTGSVADADSDSVSESESGRVTVNALPWAEVRLDGRVLGNTPRRAVSVAAGRHTLLLSCPPLGKRARVEVDVRAGEHARVVVDLQQDPPRVSRR